VANKTNVHAPDQFRGLLPERNLLPLYQTFSIKEGDKMYLPESQRVTIWLWGSFSRPAQGSSNLLYARQGDALGKFNGNYIIGPHE
jgi:hypothetical protein